MSSEKQGFDQPPPYQSPYPPQNEGYPQQQPQAQYPPQQGYPQQPGGYPPQQGYPPQGGPPPQGYAYGQGYAPPAGQYPQTTQQTVVMTQPVAGAVIIGQNRPPDYLIPSLLACFCCFWPTGLCAIYYACRANTLVGEGDMPAAQSASTTARNLMITSIVIGAICIALIIILRVALVTTSASTYHY